MVMRTEPTSQKTTRRAIKIIATNLLIQHGYRGTNFREIATRLGITTANIHYHFGNKEKLVDEVVQDYVRAAIQRQAACWLSPSLSLREKIAAVAKMNLKRFKRFNRGARSNRSWSLIGRMRLEMALSPISQQEIASFAKHLKDQITHAVDEAVERGELVNHAPKDAIVFILLNVVNSSSVLAHDSGGFQNVEHLLDAIASVILEAFGNRGAHGTTPPREHEGSLSSRGHSRTSRGIAWGC
jgi:TetR/AcrR family transcriptional repressor of nem operon